MNPESFPFLKEPTEITKQNWSDDTPPLLSIVNNTYNHENFISETIEGFLKQKTTFKVEILVHDDASTDKTTAIIREFEKKYPELILPIYQTTNQFSQGINPNREFQFPRVKGKYIAICEGDDYWTNPLKLQKQVDFLEANLDYSLCFHDFYYRSGDSIKLSKLFKGDSINFYDYATNLNGIQTLTVVYRNILKPIEDINVKSKIRGSKFYFLLLAELGKMKNINEPMAVYRIHSGGIWSGKTKFDQSKMALENIEAMILQFKHHIKIQNVLKETFSNTSIKFIKSFIKKKEIYTALKVIVMSIKIGIKTYNSSFFIYYFIKLINNNK